MWVHLALFLSTVVSDALPIVGLPAWMIMVFFWTTLDVSPWVALAVGVPGSTLGRWIFSWYAPSLSKRFLKRRKTEELAYVGRKLDGSLWRSWLFVFVYALTPLSTTVLFLAVGLGRVSWTRVIPPFFAGKLVIDTVMIFTGRYAIQSVTDLWQGVVAWKSLAATFAGLGFVAFLLFIDWRMLFEKHKLRLSWRILR